jgi:hypothetical protein
MLNFTIMITRMYFIQRLSSVYKCSVFGLFYFGADLATINIMYHNIFAILERTTTAFSYGNDYEISIGVIE